MFGNKFQSLGFIGAHSDASPILMAANFLDYVLSHFGARRLEGPHYAGYLACLLTRHHSPPVTAFCWRPDDER